MESSLDRTMLALLDAKAAWKESCRAVDMATMTGGATIVALDVVVAMDNVSAVIATRRRRASRPVVMMDAENAIMIAIQAISARKLEPVSFLLICFPSLTECYIVVA